MVVFGKLRTLTMIIFPIVIALVPLVHFASPVNGFTPSPLRPVILRKQDFTREKPKRKVPAPFTISTSLHVSNNEAAQTREAKNLASFKGLPKAIHVEGIRVPDDPSDRTTWRNGRVIGNIFEPYPIKAKQQTRQGRLSLDETQTPRQPKNAQLQGSPQGQSKDYSYNSGSTVEGRPIYYVVEEPDTLHADRSPYAYEPAGLALGPQTDQTQRNQLLDPQTASHYQIKEHTYSMCPGCPTFSIPIPVPKENDDSTDSYQSSSQSVQFQSNPSQTSNGGNGEPQGPSSGSNGFLSNLENRVEDTKKAFNDFVENLMGNFLSQPSATGTDKQDSVSNSRQPSGFMAGGIAAALIGGMALLSSAVTLSKHSSSVAALSSSNSRSDSRPGLLEKQSMCFFKMTCTDLHKDAESSDLGFLLTSITSEFCDKILNSIEDPCAT
ncbi:uncharacterized protein LOC131883237 isoform X1 [Tigriopus californicus]|uniref:uncharacterized protein LOC131883237 isoform X1 n=1 Tax=Tigriopus californicus TaxID=6832 RepID=UPI0027DA7374|nr:uncharacterized protein LOC131883237 isoform X1 [Tigriopus californicus]